MRITEFTLRLRDNPEGVRKDILECMTSGCTRVETSALLGTTVRTLARALDVLGLTGLAATSNNGTIVQLEDWLRTERYMGRALDVARAAKALYGEDTRAMQQRVRSLLQTKVKSQ